MINSQARGIIFKKSIVFFILLIFNCFQVTFQSDLIYDFQHTFVTNLNKITAITICPYDYQFSIGTIDGKLLVYNYANFKEKPEQLNGHSSKIVQILWSTSRQGLISISSDSQKVKSLAIQWDKTLSQTYRWNFDTTQTYSASLTLSPFQTYIAFNQKTKVYQYNLRSKQITKTINSRTGISDAKYSNGYRYLFVSEGPRIFTYYCGTNYAFFYEFPQIFSQIQTDFANNTGNLMIVKQNNGNFSVFQKQNRRIISKIPIPNIIRFKYCQQKYIIGLDSSKRLIIADKFTFQVRQTLNFKKTASIDISSFICDKQKILIGHSNGQVDMYKFIDEESGFDYKTLIIILVCLFVIMIIIGFVVWKKVIQKKRLLHKTKKQESLISEKFSPSAQLMEQK